MGLILTANDIFGFHRAEYVRGIHVAGDELQAHEHWIRGQVEEMQKGGHPVDPANVRPISDVNYDARPAIARVDHSRWLADCPNGDGGALLVEPGHPFMCVDCCNVDIGGQWRRVEWPDEVNEIEAALSARMLAQHRNWRSGESLVDLMRENVAHVELVRSWGGALGDG